MPNLSCNTSATTQRFIIVPKLHVLGANISNNTFNTVDTVQKEIDSIKHGIFTNIVLHVNLDPKTDAFNTQDSLSTIVNAPETNWQKANTTFTNEMTYVDSLKSILYNEYNYLSKSMFPAGNTGFYDIPSDNILNFGVIYNKNTQAYEYCLIDEGNEKCNLSLESRLATYNYRSHIGGVAPGYEMADSDLRYYHHALIGNPVTVLPGFITSDFATWYIDDDLSSQDNLVNTWDYHTIKDLNIDVYKAIYYNNLIFNFYLGGTKINPTNPQYEDSTYQHDYSPENCINSLSQFPGLNTHFWETDTTTYYIGRNSSGTEGGIQYFRYYAPNMGYIIEGDGTSNINHEYQFRYTGSLFSNPNAYSSMLGHRGDGKVVRMPEFRTDLNNATIPYSSCTDNPHSMTKQTVRYSYKNVNGELKPRVPLKSGVSNKFFNDGSHSAYSNIPDAEEGYLSDRDSILVSKGVGPEYSLMSHTTSFQGGTGSHLNIKSIPEEIEFELFYCTNINNPFASQNLFNFGRKLNKFTSGFNTGILKESVQNKLTYNYTNPNENDFVHIQQLKDYTNSSLIYGCSWEMINNAQNVNKISNLLQNPTWWVTQPTCTVVTPTVDVNNIYIWENCGVPKFGSKKLIGKKDPVTGHYTYGKYFLAYFAHNLYLIDKITFDTYFYTAQEFMELVDDMIDPNDVGYLENCTSSFNVLYNNALDPFTNTSTDDLALSYNRCGFMKDGFEM